MPIDLDLAERVRRTDKVVARYRKTPFAWAKRRTCIHLARSQMYALGHRPPPVPDFRSALGAKRALEKTGHADLVALLDSLLPRIAPAAMWPGDLAVLPGEDGFHSVFVAAGGGKVIGYHGAAPDQGVVNVTDLPPLEAAWRL